MICRWYPPGHGDFYQSFKNSGLLQEFINQVRMIFLNIWTILFHRCNQLIATILFINCFSYVFPDIHSFLSFIYVFNFVSCSFLFFSSLLLYLSSVASPAPFFIPPLPAHIMFPSNLFSTQRWSLWIKDFLSFIYRAKNMSLSATLTTWEQQLISTFSTSFLVVTIVDTVSFWWRLQTRQGLMLR